MARGFWVMQLDHETGKVEPSRFEARSKYAFLDYPINFERNRVKPQQ